MMWIKVSSCAFVGACFGAMMVALAVYLTGFGEGWCAGVMPSPFAGLGVMLTGMAWVFRKELWSPLLVLPLILMIAGGNVLLVKEMSEQAAVRPVPESLADVYATWMVLWFAWQVPAIGSVIAVIVHRLMGTNPRRVMRSIG
jgi:hypothetical protein